ncbi:MAG: tol-pal system protein YbgF [Thermodesulfovibrionia bacterium]
MWLLSRRERRGERRHKTESSVILCLLSVLILTGCATSQLGIATTDDINKIQWSVNNLKTDINAIDKRLKDVESQLSERKESEKRIDGLDESQKATSKAVSDLFIKTQSLAKDIQQLTGKLEEFIFSYGKSKDELIKGDEGLRKDISDMKNMIDEINKRLSGLEQSIAEIKKGEETRPSETKIEKPDAREAYMKAYERFKAGDNKGAREMFNSFLRDYPENEYSDNARFWIGESYYKDGNYEDAILAYEELLKKNPDSDKVAEAMLKQAMAFYELKDKKTARLILEKLIEKFPNTEQAKTAKKRLKGN